MMRSKKLTVLALVLAACGAQAPENDQRIDKRSEIAGGGADRTPRPIRSARPGDAELRRELTHVQYAVTQRGDTEPAFHNAYWNNHARGLYVDITTGQPLFTSNEKFDSGTGWPSFYRPIDPEAIVERRDRSYGMERVEVRSRIGDAHLGHLFDDGPRPTGLRYCINSAALRFIAVEDLEALGYAKYRALFPAGSPEPARGVPPGP